jgi:hypothetical protein
MNIKIMNIKKMNIKMIGLLVLVFSLLLFVFLSFLQKGKEKEKREEGFEAWNQQVVQDFIDYENTANPTFVYDVDFVQKNATEDEVLSLIENNMWPWDPDFKARWAQSVQGSPVTKYDPISQTKDKQAIYSQGAAEQILLLNTEEGRFLTRGVVLDRNTKGGDGIGSFGKTSGLDHGGDGDILRCHPDTGSMARIRRGGYDGLFSISPDVATEVPYSYLPYLVPGFSFVDAPCNPCAALRNDYSCRFTLGNK